MSIGMDWLAAFPLRPATQAVDALCESWRILAATHKPNFNADRREPELTRVLKAHVENVTSRERGILGMWATEGVINAVNFETGELVDERRTDIVYGWNDEKTGIQLVFEFKKLNRYARSRVAYLGDDGLLRFVKGAYAGNEPVAAMVGILTDAFERVVPRLKNALSDVTLGPPLKLRCGPRGRTYEQPSRLFDAADFDTEHNRVSKEGAESKPIRVAHMFFVFGYAPRRAVGNAGKRHRKSD